jgi:ABC-2 type transport system permease protein
MNAVVAMLTVRTLLGRRRTVLLMLLPAALIALCVLARVLAGADADIDQELDGGLSADLLAGFGLGTLLPLLGLIAGTGAIGPEIDDGSIVYLLAKPVNRLSIILTKLAVAIGVVTAFGAVPMLVAGTVLTGEVSRFTLAFAVGSFVAGIAYSALFLLLGVVTKNAVVVGLLYALVWESLVGQIVPGAQALSVQQWSLAVTESLLGVRAEALGVSAAVGVVTGAVLLAVVTVGSTLHAGARLRRLRLAGDS